MRLEMQSANRNELSFVLMRIMQLILEWINTRRSCQPAVPPAAGLDGTKGGRPRWFLITTKTVMQIGGRGELHVSNKHALLRSYRQITCLPFTPRAIKPLLVEYPLWTISTPLIKEILLQMFRFFLSLLLNKMARPFRPAVY